MKPDEMDAVFAALALEGRRRILDILKKEAICRELTATDRPLGAIFNSHMHTTGLGPGGRMQMRTVSGGHVIVEGDIVEYDPPRRFVHTHRFTQHEAPICTVTYELKPVAG